MPERTLFAILANKIFENSGRIQQSWARRLGNPKSLVPDTWRHTRRFAPKELGRNMLNVPSWKMLVAMAVAPWIVGTAVLAQESTQGTFEGKVVLAPVGDDPFVKGRRSSVRGRIP
jgi:hypothetical protein